MSRKPPKIIEVLHKRAELSARGAPPPGLEDAAIALLAEIGILNHDWRNIPDENSVARRRRQQELWLALNYSFRSFLESQGHVCPALNDLIDAQQNVLKGVSEDRMAHTQRVGNALPLETEYARALVIAAINKAPAGRRREVIAIGAAHLRFTSKQVNELLKNHRKGAYSRTLSDLVESIEFQIEAGVGAHVVQLREAGLLG
ncbi:hypothetical protein [Skermanella pratensis]|uniref:hypothetical protein n=1 Tax=Skermanella pratensis TaxID=2233999 RepID=UPI001301383E|nr:hypothetical protein [Skermanella pratensis]